MSLLSLFTGNFSSSSAYANRAPTADPQGTRPSPAAATRGVFDGMASNDGGRFASLYPGDNRAFGAFGAQPGSGIGSPGVPAGGLDWVYQMTHPSRDCMQTTCSAIQQHTGLTVDQSTARAIPWGTPEATNYIARLQALNLPIPLTMSYPGQGHTNADGSGHIAWANANGGQLGLVDPATQQASRYASIGPDGSVQGGYQQYQMRGILRYSEQQLAALEAQRGGSAFA